MLEQTELSPPALRCIQRQLGEALDLAVLCRQLSGPEPCGGDPLTVVVLERLASDLTDLAGSLLPLVGVDDGASPPPSRAVCSSRGPARGGGLDHRLGEAALAAEVEAMAPGLEVGVALLLTKLAALYQSSRELLFAAAVAKGLESDLVWPIC